jgi:yecA family protein
MGMEHKNGKYGVDLDRFTRLSEALSRNHQEVIPPEYWHGYLCGIGLSPTAVPEREWMGMVINRESDEDSAELEEELREALKGILEALEDRVFKPYFPGDDGDWRTCSPSQWCEGFLTASHHWPGDLQQGAGGELVALTLPVILFHNPGEYFESQASHLTESEREELMDQSFAFLPAGLHEIPGLWQEVLQEELPDEPDEYENGSGDAF